MILKGRKTREKSKRKKGKKVRQKKSKSKKGKKVREKSKKAKYSVRSIREVKFISGDFVFVVVIFPPFISV